MNTLHPDIVFVGLTGQSGAGKTTAGEFFVEQNYGVINCDMVSRKVVSDGSGCLKELVREFGVFILNKDDTLNRGNLAEIVFSDNKKLMRLNEIIFPYITDKILSVSEELINAGFKVIVLDAPTLFESGLNRICDIVIAVVADYDTRVNRIIERDKISQEMASARIASQYDDNFFKEKSDMLITNNGNKDELLQNLLEITEHIKNFKKVV